MTDAGDAVFMLLVWVIAFCVVFGLAAYVVDRIEAAGR